MASHKLNIANVTGCPPLLVAKVALETLGRPSDKDYGILAVHDIQGNRLDFGIFRSKTVSVNQVDKVDGSSSVKQMTRDEMHEASLILLDQEKAVLEVTTGSVKSTDVVGEFLAALELSDGDITVETITQDVFGRIVQLKGTTNKLFAIMSARLKGYQDVNDEKVSGNYSVRFAKDAGDNALAFIQDHADKLEQVKLKYRPDNFKKPMTITIRPSAYFTFSCCDEDVTKAKNFCRKLCGFTAGY